MQKRELPSLKEHQTDLKGRYVVVRSSLNVPLEEGVVENMFRIERAKPTLDLLTKEGAKVILIAHIGREPEDTLLPVYEVLKKTYNITWARSCVPKEVQTLRDELKEGSILMLENVRQDPRETKNDAGFAKELAGLGDIFVNDAFAVGHREQTSIVGIAAHLPTYFGINFMHEYDALSGFMNPEHPSLFLLGGAKFKTKLPLIEAYLDTYDHIFVGGALANDFFKAKGYELGTSLVSDVDLSKSPIMKAENILLPVDVTVLGKNGMRIITPDSVESHESILDVGPETITMLAPYIENAKNILWNGPFGNYEHGFNEQTEACAKLVAESKGYSLVGGGDTVAAIESLGLEKKFNFISTAGGAMLTFLETGTLAAIEAVEKSKK